MSGLSDDEIERMKRETEETADRVSLWAINILGVCLAFIIPLILGALTMHIPELAGTGFTIVNVMQVFGLAMVWWSAKKLKLVSWQWDSNKSDPEDNNRVEIPPRNPNEYDLAAGVEEKLAEIEANREKRKKD